jgi:hypothetical protein
MDVIGSVILAVGAFALLQVAALQLRGEARHGSTRSPRRRG